MLYYMKRNDLSGTVIPPSSSSVANGKILPSLAPAVSSTAVKSSQEDIGAAIAELDDEERSQPSVEVGVAAD